MRFETVTAHAFGPFVEQTLRFAPGLTVIHGPNEAGKSSWHAAIFAGLCGLPGGQGQARGVDKTFVERHRPWDRPDWAVGAVVALADGRRAELRHDLHGRSVCRVNADGPVHDGALDGARWLGLDRRSFLATACVRQSDLLGVLAEPALLQEFLQRATATSGADATAAEALRRIAEYHQEHVGRDAASSTKPLRQAVLREAAARRALARAHAEHAELLALLAKAQELERRAATARRALRLVQARRAADEAADWAERLARARRLAERHPLGPPPSRAADEALAQEAAATLSAWQALPPAPLLSGQSAAELRAELAALPPAPDGDLQPDAAAVEARDQARAAEWAVQLHELTRPAGPAGPTLGPFGEAEIRDLLRELDAPQPTIDPALAPRVAEARHLVAEQTRPAPRRGPLAGGILLAILGPVLALLGQALPGLALVLLGSGLLFFALRGGPRKASPAALATLQEAERALAAQQAIVEAATQRYERAVERALALGLPTEPGELLTLSEQLAAAGRAEQELARWQEQARQLVERHRAAEARLLATLRARGAEVEGQPLEAFARYEQACRQRAGQAGLAARRAELERLLAERTAREQAAAEASGRALQAGLRLRQVAARCGLAGGRGPELAQQVQGWLAQRQARLATSDEARREWAELEALLSGSTLSELQTEAYRRRMLAERLAEGLDPAALALCRLDADVDAQVEQLDQAARETAAAYEQVRGQAEERRRTAPSVPEATELLAAAELELARIRQLDRALTLARQHLSEAQARVQRAVAPALAASIRRWLPEVTTGRYVDARVDPDTLDVQVRDLAGRWRRAALLSHGTAEQVYLLLRVAMAERLTRPGEVCPLVLDDVTVQCDAERKQAVLRVLHVLSRERQVILFSQEEDVLAWARANLDPARDRLERLERRAPAA